MLYQKYKATGFARKFKHRRYLRIIHALGISPPASVLEIGCANGADFIRFALADGFTCHGVDLAKLERLCDFQFTQADAQKLPFKDNAFDAVVSIGVLEHIPVQELCRVTAEMARVSKRSCTIVPAVSTPIEPHTLSLLWSIRSKKKACPYPLYFYSDETWKTFPGLATAQTERFWYMPGFHNLMITNSMPVHR